MDATDTTSPMGRDATRADLHCHSTASQESRLGVQRAAGLPECATPPQEVYELARRRGMDFVTITDHDTIAGALEIADLPGVFLSVELTASFRGEPQAVHVLCYGITPEDHEWLAGNRGDVELCAAYMYEREIVCALAHPYYTVAAPLGARHRRRLAELFPVWEVRNGARARELNRPAATYVATRDGIGVGGSDDHAGVDIGRTFTEAPAARTPREFLEHVREGRVLARGAHGSAAKWAHAAIALAARSLGEETPRGRRPDPGRVLAMVRRLLSEADAREGSGGGEVTPQDAGCLLRAWLDAVELGRLDARALIDHMQSERFEHADLQRHAHRVHERKLREAVAGAVAAVHGAGELAAAAEGLFEACIAAVPYAPAAAFLASEQAKLAAIPDALARPVGGAARREDGERARVALVADGIGSTHGVTRAIQEIRARGVPGYEIEVLGTDADVDRRLPAVTELDLPFYEGLKIGVPSLPAAVQALAEGGYEAVHVCAPGPAGVLAAMLARTMGLPLIGSYHTELTAYAGVRAGGGEVAAAMAAAMAALYGSCDVVLSPSLASDDALRAIGVAGARIARWDRGVDAARFDPGLRRTGLLGGELSVLYAGRITSEKGADLLADAFLRARARDGRLRLVLAGGGPEEERLRERVGDGATFLGWLAGEELARAYASADMFLFPSSTDTFGQVILEAQASGLPVVAVARGGPATLIEDRDSGLLCEPDADALAGAVLELAASPLLRRRLARGGLAAARGRTWEASMARLAAGYDAALAVGGSSEVSRAA